MLAVAVVTGCESCGLRGSRFIKASVARAVSS